MNQNELIEVTMQLSAEDAKNTDELVSIFRSPNKASAVSNAITVTSSLAHILQDGSQLLVKHPNGDLNKVTIPGLTRG